MEVTLKSVDESTYTFELTRKSSEPPHDVGALIPIDIVAANAQRRRLLELAEWVAENGIIAEGKHRLARDLLLRAPPMQTARGELAPSLLLANALPSQAPVRLA